jgi:hypothetical protein
VNGKKAGLVVESTFSNTFLQLSSLTLLPVLWLCTFVFYCSYVS